MDERRDGGEEGFVRRVGRVEVGGVVAGGLKRRKEREGRREGVSAGEFRRREMKREVAEGGRAERKDVEATALSGDSRLPTS